MPERRLLVTGLGGTLAPRIAAAAQRAGWKVHGWDRRRLATEDAGAVRAALDVMQPRAVVHAATGSAGWAATLADWAALRALPFVYVSSAMVFDAEPDGPHHVDDAPTAKDSYGRGKITGEAAVRDAHPGASLVRIGWQIDPERPGNNMLMQLDGWQRDHGEVATSRAWTPACSFMDDTAEAMVALLARPEPGLVHLDSNAAEGHRFDAVVAALQAAFGRTHWRLRVHEDYRHDQRLVGGPRTLPPLSARLPTLRMAD